MLLLIVALPTAVLIPLVLWRKAAAPQFRFLPGDYNRPSVLKVKIPADSLSRTKSIWTDRQFVEVTNEDTLRNAIDDLTGKLALQAGARTAASRSCYDLLLGYGTGDWDKFKSARIPSPNYHIDVRTVSKANAIEQYHSLWNKTVKTGLYNEVSFNESSVGVFDLPVEQISTIRFPTITASTNENWFQVSPLQLFDYKRTELQYLTNAQVLRFFFFGKAGAEVNLYMVTFVWDEGISEWLPWRLTIAYSGPPKHNLLVF